MVKKWVPTYDGHDMELVEVEKIGSENSDASIVSISRNRKREVVSAPGFSIHPTVTRLPHHPKYLHSPGDSANIPDLTYTQIDEVLHVLGDYFPPDHWNMGEVQP